MPNHVYHRVNFKGNPESVEKLKQQIQTVHEDENSGAQYTNHIGFNKIIPRPETISNVESISSHESKARELFSIIRIDSKYSTEKSNNSITVNWFKEYISKYLPDSAPEKTGQPEDEFENMVTIIFNLSEYGVPTWYEWSNKYWNTKWNAYETEYKDGELRFETAWSTPYPVLLKLSEIFPDVEIHVDYANEDLGCNCGRVLYQGGNITEFDLDNTDFKNPTHFAFWVRYGDDPEIQKEYGFNENWEYVG